MNKPIREGFVAAPVTEPDAPPVDEAPAIIEPTWPIKVKLLHRPVRNHKNEEVRELSFREPTGGDINRLGNPCQLGPDWQIIIDDKRMMMMISALSGVLTPNLEQMDPRDYNSCAYRLRGFFLPEPAAWV